MPDTAQKNLVKKDLPRLPRPNFLQKPAVRRGIEGREAAVKRGIEGRSAAVKRGEAIRKKARKKK